jgi:hypothetical protein
MQRSLHKCSLAPSRGPPNPLDDTIGRVQVTGHRASGVDPSIMNDTSTESKTGLDHSDTHHCIRGNNNKHITTQPVTYTHMIAPLYPLARLTSPAHINMVRECAGGRCARGGYCPSRVAHVRRERGSPAAADTCRELPGERGNRAQYVEERDEREAEVHRCRRRGAFGRGGWLRERQ